MPTAFSPLTGFHAHTRKKGYVCYIFASLKDSNSETLIKYRKNQILKFQTNA